MANEGIERAAPRSMIRPWIGLDGSGVVSALAASRVVQAAALDSFVRSDKQKTVYSVYGVLPPISTPPY